MMRRLALPVGILLIGGAFAAVESCGSPDPAADAELLSPRQVRGLPLDEYGLQNLCPEKSGVRGAAAARLRRRRQRQLERLLETYRAHPRAAVRATYTPAHQSHLAH